MFLLYLALHTTYLVACVIALARPGWSTLAVAVSTFVATACLRQLGYRRLDFERLCKSFPAGCTLDQVPEPVRNEVERLFTEFTDSETDWVRRVEIRHRLIALEKREPRIVDAYAVELKQVLVA